MKKVFLLFVAAFLSNAIWENIHSFLYDHYRGGEITEFILLRATLADAVMITVIAAPFALLPRLRHYRWLIIPIFLAVAIMIELYALSTGRWAYNEYMPLVPFLGVGLSPTIQLALLGYLSVKIQEYLSSRRPSGK